MHMDLRIKTSRGHQIAAIVATTTLLICGPVQAGKIYKWVDENGKTHYGDNARSNSGIAQEIHVPKTPAVDASVNTRKERTERLLGAFKQERDEKRDSRQAAAEEKKKRVANCAAAETSQYKYEHVSTLYKTDADGNRVNLTDEEYAKAMADLQTEVDRWCG